jgi:phosphodiesterase/alkaline phosphatase D-like protein
MPKSSIILGPIVGGLNSNSANIWARADAPSTLHVWLARQADCKDARHVGEAELTAQDGFSGIVRLTKLRPETKYYYAVSLRNVRPARANFHSFITFPKDSARRSFSFAFGSCYLPPDAHGGQTMDVLNSRIEPDGLRFGLMLGDQVYADDATHNGLGHVAVTLDEYRSVYAHTWSLPSMRGFHPNLPLFMILDDHEVADDWCWDDATRNNANYSLLSRILQLPQRPSFEQSHLTIERVRAALKAYHEHQAMHAPAPVLPPQTNTLGQFLFQEDEGSFAYTFTYGSAAFFVFDTRTMRVKKGKKALLGEAQWKVLETWFKDVKDKYPVKFIVSSGTIFYPFLLDVSRDRWSGFHADRERLFELLAVNEIEGVHILTGDIHTAHAISAELKCPSGKRIPIFEFCASPFEQEIPWVGITYVPLISKWIRKQKRLFRQTGQNFGVVHVDFDGPTPRVTFHLHYNEGGWKTRQVVTG